MQETLLVLPNPFTFIDGDGEPQGACPADPGHAAGKRMWIGARLDRERTRIDTQADEKLRGKQPLMVGKHVIDERPRPQVTKFNFVTEPVEIPMTPHYLDRIREGDLIAADERTYRKACGSARGYLKPDEALAREKARAAAHFLAEHGEPAPFANAPSDADDASVATPGEQP